MQSKQFHSKKSGFLIYVVTFTIFIFAGIFKPFGLPVFEIINTIATIIGLFSILILVCLLILRSYKPMKKNWANFKKNRRLEKWKEKLTGFDSVIVYVIRTEKDSKSRIEIDRYLLWLGFDPKEIDAAWKVFDVQPQ